jgi:hypothetical protein
MLLTDISEEFFVSIFREKNYPSKKPAKIRWQAELGLLLGLFFRLIDSNVIFRR